jgi:hypothetical protein
MFQSPIIHPCGEDRTVIGEMYPVGLALLYISVRFALKLVVTVNVQVSLSVIINGPTRSDVLDRTLIPSPTWLEK